MSTLAATVDFGAPVAQGAHLFRVEISPQKDDPVKITEDYGLQGGSNLRTYSELRVILPRQLWSGISEAARRNFNERLKAARIATGRWKSGVTLVERLLGKELCVLAWAAEQAAPPELPIICSKWGALRPEERWWLFSVTVAEAGLAHDTQRGWRKALYCALSDGERINTDRKIRPKRPPEEGLQGLLLEVNP